MKKNDEEKTMKNKSSTCTVGFTLYALKGQKHLAQGSALGKTVLECRPVRAKA